MKKVLGTNLNPKGSFPTTGQMGWPSGRQKAPMNAKPQIPWGNIKFGKVMNPKLKRSLTKKGLSRNFS